MLIKRSKVHDIARELAEGTERTLDTTGENVHDFVRQFLERISWSVDDLRSFYKEKNRLFLDSIMHSLHSPHHNQRIPHIVHKIWITSESAPVCPDDDLISRLFKSVESAPSDWKFIFWTNSNHVASAVLQKKIQSNARAILILNLNDINLGVLKDNISTLIRDNKYVLAADLLKIAILHEFGGIYADLGVHLANDLLNIFGICDYVFMLGQAGFLQTSMLAMPPQSQLALMFLGILSNPEVLAISPSQQSAFRALDEVRMFAGPGFTACTLMFCPDAARVFIIPPQSNHHKWSSLKSWYGNEGKFGNVLISTSTPSILSDDRAYFYESIADQSTWFHNCSEFFVEKIRLLLKMHGYFDGHATLLCSIFFYCGSDKAMAWHNYGYIYNYILECFVGKESRFLEVGIGTNFIDVPSSMKASGIPGASLRAWREFFINASIHGADVDRRILFQEKDISTFFVDQLDLGTIDKLFSEIREENFDIIIDDGLHTMQANLNLLSKGINMLRNDGIYIVEDVAHSCVDAWREFIENSTYSGAILQLPHSKNKNDNCLVIISRHRLC